MQYDSIHIIPSQSFDPISKRIGLIVPSSNVTMETELPMFFSALSEPNPTYRFTIHSSRVRMKHVNREELLAMNAQAERSALELADAGVDVILYACLVAVMVEGENAHCTAESRLENLLASNGHVIPVVSSAGALIRTLDMLNIKKIDVLTPYKPELTKVVCSYLESQGSSIIKAVSRSVSDNSLVGKLSILELKKIASECSAEANGIVLSACVQMPSALIIEEVEREVNKTVITAASATFFQAMLKLGIQPELQGFGSLLNGKYAKNLN